ncbi:MAG: hypothetical protein JWO82_2741 [Akkermansiaceae bacterium]|nr:hypothetical protein [Akkermansiaceae bacterium]
MSPLRKFLAIFAGVLLGLLFTLPEPGKGMQEAKLIPGLLFAVVYPIALIRRPERLTRQALIFMAVLLLSAVIYFFVSMPSSYALLFAAYGIALLVDLAWFVALGKEERTK